MAAGCGVPDGPVLSWTLGVGVGALVRFLGSSCSDELDTDVDHDYTHGLARRQIQRDARILPGRLRLWGQYSSVHPEAFHLGHLLVLGWRFLEGQLRGQFAGERGRLELWVERQTWLGQAQEKALRRLRVSIEMCDVARRAHHLAGRTGFWKRQTS